MKQYYRFSAILILLLCLDFLPAAFGQKNGINKTNFKFPYQQAGLTSRQAAAHLLSRFSYGSTPGQVDKVVQTGLENWFATQLKAGETDDSLNNLLAGYDALTMSNQAILNTYAERGKILKMMIEDGVINKEEATSLREADKSKYRIQVAAYMRQKGLKPKAELTRQLINQKILRAAYSKNQLKEVLTAFWFNHFNISLTKNESARFILGYERDVIRPNALGNFGQLLLATAKSPAMLTYLDNAKSMVEKQRASISQLNQQQRMMQLLEIQQQSDIDMQQLNLVEKVKNAKKTQGLNENYAREIMELHTMGVDAGYTQTDVTEAARILTGWTVYPMEGYGQQVIKKINRRISEEQLSALGFVHEGDFLFAANKHDFMPKRFLSTDFPPGNGYQEGQKLVSMLAHHPATAAFICKKLATRFVCDDPPISLINKMAETFTQKDGDIKAVLLAMVTAPEFWSKTALREKIKSPFELAISAVRATNASVSFPYQLYTWIAKMGEQVYAYQAPTGFPDKGKYWINTGSLLYRMNFGLAFANNRIPGVNYNADELSNHHEPESAETALKIYGNFLMPERDLDETVKRMTPLMHEPGIEKKIVGAVAKVAAGDSTIESDEEAEMLTAGRQGNDSAVLSKQKNQPSDASNLGWSGAPVNNVITQVIGILVGSPEFQRR